MIYEWNCGDLAEVLANKGFDVNKMKIIGLDISDSQDNVARVIFDTKTQKYDLVSIDGQEV